MGFTNNPQTDYIKLSNDLSDDEEGNMLYHLNYNDTTLYDDEETTLWVGYFWTSNAEKLAFKWHIVGLYFGELSLASNTDYWVVFGFGPGGVSSTIIGSGNNEVAGCAALYGGDVEGSE